MRFSIFLLVLLCSCSSSDTNSLSEKDDSNAVQVNNIDTIPTVAELQISSDSTSIVNYDYDTTKWTELKLKDGSIILDLRYATDNNFVEEQMYDCGRCFLRPEAAEAVLKLHADLKKKGKQLKFFDCYRPRPIQWKLWNKIPDPRYVSDPRKGSMHNRGLAVDLTIADANGNELDMGTDFDFFGKEAYHEYTQLSDTILANRKLLKESMEAYGFKPIRTEWWHYSFQAKMYPVSDMVWECHNEKNPPKD